MYVNLAFYDINIAYKGWREEDERGGETNL
jgi:hypothetical protein